MFNFRQFRCPVAWEGCGDFVLLEASARRAATSAASVWLAPDPVAAIFCSPAAAAAAAAVAAAHILRFSSDFPTATASDCNLTKLQTAAPNSSVFRSSQIGLVVLHAYRPASDGLIAAAASLAAAAAAVGYVRQLRWVLSFATFLAAVWSAILGFALLILAEQPPLQANAQAKAAFDNAETKSLYIVASLLMATAAIGNSGLSAALLLQPFRLPESAAAVGAFSFVTMVAVWHFAAVPEVGGRSAAAGAWRGASGPSNETLRKEYAREWLPLDLVADEFLRGPLLLILAIFAVAARHQAQKAKGRANSDLKFEPLGLGEPDLGNTFRTVSKTTRTLQESEVAEVDWNDVLAAAVTFGGLPGSRAGMTHGSRSGQGKMMTLHQVPSCSFFSDLLN